MSWFRKSRHTAEPRAVGLRGVTDLPLPDGRVVKYLDSRFTPGGELGAMDILEGKRWAAILRTSEGNYIPWIDGHTGGWARTLNSAVEQLSDILASRESFQ